MGAGATGAADFSKAFGRCESFWPGGRRRGGSALPGSPACVLFRRWHFRSEEPPQRTLRDENPLGNKLRELQRYSFLLPCQASPFCPALATLGRALCIPPPVLAVTVPPALNAFPFSVSLLRTSSRPVSLESLYAFSSSLDLFSLRGPPVKYVHQGHSIQVYGLCNSLTISYQVPAYTTRHTKVTSSPPASPQW